MMAYKIFLVFLLVDVCWSYRSKWGRNGLEVEEEEIGLVETVPSGLEFGGSAFLKSIGESLIEMVRNAKSDIAISSMYFSLRNNVTHPIDSDKLGARLFKELVRAAKRNVHIRIVVTSPTMKLRQFEVVELTKRCPHVIEVGFLDMTRMTKYLSGVHHTKLYVVDNQTFFIGSANSDWRALSEIAEIGIVGKNVPEAAKDLMKIFEMYWYLSDYLQPQPVKWPASLETSFNRKNPLMVGPDSIPIYFTSTPGSVSTKNRTGYLESYLHVIDTQVGGVLRLCAMTFSSETYYMKNSSFWGLVDYSLRKATMERNVTVYLLVDSGGLKNDKMYRSLQTLHLYNEIYVKKIEFPDLSVKIPYARLFHSKLCIGDSEAFIGNNNLTPDDFLDTAGMGCTISGSTSGGSKLVADLKHVFDRYYFSKYATNLF